MELVADWSDLLPELVAEVSLRLAQTEDFMAFRGVCRSWRAGAAKDRFRSKAPLLMLAEKDGSDEREFYSLSKGKICARLPFLGAKGKKCMDAGFGWIFTLSASVNLGETNGAVDGETDGSESVEGAGDGEADGSESVEGAGDEAGDGGADDEIHFESDDELYVDYETLFGNIQGETDGEVHLVKPFDSSAVFQLPNIKTFPKYDELETWPDYYFIRRAMLSANPSETSDFVLLVLVNHCLGFWRNEDNHWTSIDLGIPIHSGNLALCQGKMYAVNGDGNIHVWDPSGSAEVILTLNRPEQKYLMSATPYLVESTDGELLLIMRNNISPDEYFEKGTTEFKVMRVDPVKRTCKNIKGVGKDAIFLGDNHTTAVAAADFPGVLKPNCIYFTDDNIAYFCYHYYDKSRYQGGGKDMGIYNLEDNTIERLDVESFSLISPPQWIFP